MNQGVGDSQSEDLETPEKPGCQNGNKLVLETTRVETIGTEKIGKWLSGGRGKGMTTKDMRVIQKGAVMESLYILMMAEVP